MTQPDINDAYKSSPVADDYDDVMTPGTARWYLNRLCRRLMGRQGRYDRLERYALGNHPLPNGDQRFVVALSDLQKKAKTNYIELVISAVTTRMDVTGFRVGDGKTTAPPPPSVPGAPTTAPGTPPDPATASPTDPTAPADATAAPAPPATWTDDDASEIWKFNDMDFQSPIIINTGATFGDTYVCVTPPDPDDLSNPNQLPLITAEDPRECIVEMDPARPTRTLCGLKMWQDDVAQVVFAVIDDGLNFYEYQGPALNDIVGQDTATLTKRLLSHPSEGGFFLISVTPNTLGEVSIVRGNWQPRFGTQGRGEAEVVLDIQDRINHTILDRLVISKSQAYNQRWVTGGDPKNNTTDRKWKPGPSAVWALSDKDAKFGQFEAADITPLLAAIRDDVGDMAAVSQTPGTYLMNRMVNVSGDTLTQDQVALVQKIKARMTAMGWMYQKVMRLCFMATGDVEKAQSVDVQTLWVDPEIYDLAAMADAFQKLQAAGMPLQLIMEKFNYSPDEIAMALAEQQRQEQMASQQAQQQAEALSQQQGVQNDHEQAITKSNNDTAIQQTKISAAAKSAPSKTS